MNVNYRNKLIAIVLCFCMLFINIPAYKSQAIEQTLNDENIETIGSEAEEIVTDEKLEEDSADLDTIDDDTPEMMFKLLGEKQAYSELSDNEKQSVSQFFGVNDGLMQEAEGKGLNLLDSINVVSRSVRYDIQLEQMIDIISSQSDLQQLDSKLIKYDAFIKRYEVDQSLRQDIRSLFLANYDSPYIYAAYVISQATQLDINILIVQDEQHPQLQIAELGELTEDEQEVVEHIASQWAINLIALQDYRIREDITWKALLAQISAFVKQYEIKETPTEQLRGISSLQSEPPQVDYNKYIQSPYNIAQNNNEVVQGGTGYLSYSIGNYMLAGRNGLDLALGVSYDSSDANLLEADFYYYSSSYTDYDYQVSYGAKAYYSNWIGTGPFPSGDIAEKVDGTYETFEQAQARATTLIGQSYVTEDYWSDGTDLIVQYYAIIEPVYDPVDSYSSTIKEDRTYPHTYSELQNNLGSGWSFAFSSIEKDRQGSLYLHLSSGGKYRIQMTAAADDSNLENYTLKDIRLEADSGSYTNAQNQKSAYVLIHSSGYKEYFADDGRLLAMRDRYGNTIAFEHQVINNHPVISKITDTLGRIVTFQYQTISNGKTLTVTLPDSSTIQYISESLPNKAGEYVLKKIIDQAGRETSFTYDVQGCTANFSFFNKNTRSKQNSNACLTQVTHPTGAVTKYTYEKAVSNLGSQGSAEFYRIKTREDIADGISNNKLTYTYTDNFSGYPTYSDASALPTSFQFSMTAAQPNNVSTTYTFNNKHLTVKSELKNGAQPVKVIEYQHNADKLPTVIKTTNYNIGTTQNASSTEQYTYDAWGNVLSYTNALNQQTTFTYDNVFHFKTSETMTMNANITQKTEWTIQPATGNVTQKKQHHKVNGVDKSIVTNYNYDMYGNVVTETINKHDGGSVTLNYEYSSTYSNGYLTRMYQTVRQVDNTSHVLQYRYNYNIKTGDVTSYLDGEGRTYQYQYDKLGRLTKLVNPDQSTQQLNYDDVNNIVTATNEMGYKTRNLYDRLGRLVKVQTYKNGTWLTQEEKNYDELSRVSWSKDVSGDATSYQYDVLDRATRITNPDSTYKQIRYYDAWLNEGNTSRMETIDEAGYIATTYYDKLGSKVAEQLVDKVRYEYDVAGNVTKFTDANGKQTLYTYDDLNRLIKVTNALNETTSYEYDHFGNVIKIIHPNGDNVQSIYDDAGRVSKKIDGMGLIEQFIYDRNNNLIRRTDPEGQVFTYTYDNRNRLTKITATNASGTYTQTFTYNLAGQRLTAQSDGRTFQYAYHADDGSLVKVTYPDQKFISLSSFEAESRVEMKEPFGMSFHFMYDNRNRLDRISIGAPNSPPQVDYSYTANGKLAATQFMGTVEQGNINNPGMKQEYRYYTNAANQLQTVQHKKPDGTVLNSYSYSYDKNFNINKVDSSIQGSGATSYSFTYDEINRINTSTDGSESYSYDLRGNRLTMQSNKNKVYEDAQYKYNIWGQLVEVVNTRGTTKYIYDPDGMLYERTDANGERNRYYFLQSKLIAEGVVAANNTATLKMRYVHGHGVAFQNGPDGTAYYYKNGHGDVVELRNAAGELLNQYSYDIWGNPEKVMGSNHNIFRYSGEYWDEDTGLQYLRARWYDPSIGRFISEDTYEGDVTNPLTLNLYTYVHNNPLIYVDPSGNRIVVVGDDEYKKQVLSDLQELTSINLQMDKDGVVTQIEAICPTPESDLAKGSQLIYELIAHDKTVTIEEYDKNNGHAIPDSGFKSIYGRGSNSTIQYNTNYNSNHLSYNSELNRSEYQRVSSYITLGHELIHARSHMNGTRIDPSKKVTYTYIDENGVKHTIKAKKNELVTVGIIKHKDFNITENDLRLEHGFNNRIRY